MLTHIDSNNNQPSMVDVGDKSVTKRSATARCFVFLGTDIIAELSNGDIQTKKGPVFQTAIIAGTMAVKKTADLIPFCHPLTVDSCKIVIGQEGLDSVFITCTVSVTAKTGVEMEALTGASIAALTVYDMCKAMSHDIKIKETGLVEKTGGKNDFRRE